jgi:hypothetical protein
MDKEGWSLTAKDTGTINSGSLYSQDSSRSWLVKLSVSAAEIMVFFETDEMMWSQ